MKPQAYYWRASIKQTDDPERLREYALELVTWLELDKAAMRARGIIPPKHGWAPGERADKRGSPLDRMG